MQVASVLTLATAGLLFHIRPAVAYKYHGVHVAGLNRFDV